jgi:hypothetical protein
MQSVAEVGALPRPRAWRAWPESGDARAGDGGLTRATVRAAPRPRLAREKLRIACPGNMGMTTTMLLVYS